jgi:exodeoxyribonuclease-1
MAFVFYDTETTGTNPAFDQILQFGAIRTDDDLNELERFEIRCRLLPHVVPSEGRGRAFESRRVRQGFQGVICYSFVVVSCLAII